MIYENRDEVQRRLANTVVMYNGEPVYVVEATGGGARQPRLGVSVRPFPVEPGQAVQQFTVFLDDPLLSYRTFQLGYFNWPGIGGHPSFATYVSRTAARRGQQGLDDQNTVCTNSPRGARVRFSSLQSIPSNFREFMRGQYPSFLDARARVHGDGVDDASWAFHRSFALSYDRKLGIDTLHYKGRRVGHCNSDNRLLLGPDYGYLKELVLSQRIEGINV